MKIISPAESAPLHGNRVLITVDEFNKFQQSLNVFSSKLTALTANVKSDSDKMDELQKELVTLQSLVKTLSNDISNIALAFKTYIGGNNT